MGAVELDIYRIVFVTGIRVTLKKYFALLF